MKLNSNEQFPCKFTKNTDFLSNEKRIFCAAISGTVSGILVLVSGIALATLPIGLNTITVFSCATLAFVIGFSAITYSLLIMCRQANLWRENCLEAKRSLGKLQTKDLNQNFSPSNATSTLYETILPACKDEESINYSKILSSVARIILGISCIIVGITTEFLNLSIPIPGLSITLTMLGTGLFTLGISGLKIYNLNARGVLREYVRQHEQLMTDKKEEDKLRKIRHLEKRAINLSTDLHSSSDALSSLQMKYRAELAKTAALEKCLDERQQEGVPSLLSKIQAQISQLSSSILNALSDSTALAVDNPFIEDDESTGGTSNQ